VFLLALIFFSFLKEFFCKIKVLQLQKKKNTHNKQLADIKQHFFF